MSFIIRKLGNRHYIIESSDLTSSRIIRTFSLYAVPSRVLIDKILSFLKSRLPHTQLPPDYVFGFDTNQDKIYVRGHNFRTRTTFIYIELLERQNWNETNLKLISIHFDFSLFDDNLIHQIIKDLYLKIVELFNSILELYSLAQYMDSHPLNPGGEIDRNDPLSTALILYSNARVVEIARILDIPAVPPGTVQNISNVFRILKLGLADPRVPL